MSITFQLFPAEGRDDGVCLLWLKEWSLCGPGLRSPQCLCISQHPLWSQPLERLQQWESSFLLWSLIAFVNWVCSYGGWKCALNLDNPQWHQRTRCPLLLICRQIRTSSETHRGSAECQLSLGKLKSLLLVNPFLLNSCLFYFKCVCLPACMLVRHICAWCLPRPGDSVRSHGAGVAHGCKLPCGCWPWLGSLEAHPGPLTTGPSLWTQPNPFQWREQCAYC